jgi:hypothetical protein
MRKAHLVHLRSEPLGLRERRPEGVEHAGFDPLPRELLRHAEPDAVEALGGGQLDLLRK